eukprot:scaffold1318_cov272-Ochromonas_danica.AAC.1
MDTNRFKSFVEGTVYVKLLYENGTHEVKHYSIPIFTANNMPNLHMDSGVERRLRGYTHTSKFTDKDELVDEKNHVYKVHKGLLEDIEKYHLLDTFVDILAFYAKEWIDNGETDIELPDSFVATTEDIVDTNDQFKDFIDSMLEFRGKNESEYKVNRIGKNEMLELYSEMYPKRPINHQILRTSLCERGVKWDRNLRGNDQTKGCYIGVVRKQIIDGIVTDDDTVRKEVDDYYKSELEMLRLQIRMLEKENAELKKENYKDIIQPISKEEDDDEWSLCCDEDDLTTDEVFNMLNADDTDEEEYEEEEYEE